MEASHPEVVRDLLEMPESFVHRLRPDTRDRLLDVARTRRVPAGEAIFSGSGQHLGFVLEGTARSDLVAPTGRRITVRYVRRGSMIGAWAVAGDGDLSVVNRAVTNCAVIEFDVETVAGLIRSDPGMALTFVEYLTARLQATYQALAASAFGTMTQRIARHLLELAEEDPEDGRVVAAITQQQLADGIGTSREVVARTLRRLRSDGTVRTHSREIEISNPAALASLVSSWPRPTRSRPSGRPDDPDPADQEEESVLRRRSYSSSSISPRA